MNKYFLLLLSTLFVLITLDANAQLSDEAELPEKYRELSIGIGPRTLSTTPGVISTNFTDNSPAQDVFMGTFDVEESYSRMGLHVGYNWGRYNGLSHKVLVDFALGDQFAGIFNYGIGWNISKAMGSKILNINPGIFAGFGNYGFGIGDIENSSVFIQIGQTQYFDDKLDITLTSQVFLYGPECSIDVDLSDHIRLWVNAAYDIASSNNKPKLTFKGSEAQSELETNDTNPRVTYNGELVESLPYDPSGIRLTVGFSYVWHRY